MGKTADAATSSSTDMIRVCEALEERYGRRKAQKFTDFIEALVYQILELGAQEKATKDGLKRLRDEYTDWNDMRVATVREIEDILGHKYYRVREKAEDIKHLLADLYTAFRRMEIQDLLNADGIATLRALPDTTNVRRDMVERALLLVLDVKVFPCDEDQFKLLKFLGGVPKPLSLQQGAKKVEETLDADEILRLSRGLREHVHIYTGAGEDEPQIIAFGWDQPDPLGMDKGRKAEKPEPIEKPVKAGKPAKAEKPEKAVKPAKVEKAEKAEKTEKTEKAEKAEKPAAKPTKAEAKPEKSAKTEKPAKAPAKTAAKPAAQKKK